VSWKLPGSVGRSSGGSWDIPTIGDLAWRSRIEETAKTKHGC
jgi:hypothetical protein